jgi:hypothetical protein
MYAMVVRCSSDVGEVSNGTGMGWMPGMKWEFDWRVIWKYHLLLEAARAAMLWP